MRLRTDEELLLRKLIEWDKNRLPIERLLGLVSLAFGGGVIAWVAYYTLSNLTDSAALWATVPGFLTGLFLIGVYVLARGRVEERHRVVVLLKKLTSSYENMGDAAAG